MDGLKIANPFVVGKYVSDDFFCDRQTETNFLRKQVVNGRNTAIIAPRRLGKTGLIRHFFAQPDVQKQFHTFFIDIYATDNLSDFVSLFGKEIFNKLKPIQAKRMERFFGILKSLRPGLKLDAVTGEPVFDIGLGQIEQPKTTLDEIFTYLESADKPCVVCIDEFQQIMDYEEKNVEALLRTKVQECKQTLFIFSGSRRHLMSQIFNSSSKPFYQSVISADLKPLDRSLYIDFAMKLFEDYDKRIQRDLVGKVYDQYEGVTWYMQMILNELFAITKEGEECTSAFFEIALRNVIQIQESSYQDTMAQLPARQKPVFIAIAKEVIANNVTSAGFVKRYGLGAASSVQAAVKGLLEKDLVTRTDKGYRVYDYFLAEWIRWNF
ncbi:MAG: ATP-binding protein [Bacteroidales bacterium]|nr:ATP-binding protein [Bacteroidales bacterium]